MWFFLTSHVVYYKTKRNVSRKHMCIEIQIPLQKIVQSIAQCEVNSSSKESTILLCAYSWGPHVELLENEQNLYVLYILTCCLLEMSCQICFLWKRVSTTFFKKRAAKIGFESKVNMLLLFFNLIA